LTNDRLIGAIVVGTGLPQVSNEREILKNHYDVINGEGFDYAFRFPGMNKVLQAAGRVIRTTEDLGIILLLDERFLQSDYQQLYPREWNKRSICNVNTVETFVTEFWKKSFNQRIASGASITSLFKSSGTYSSDRGMSITSYRID